MILKALSVFSVVLFAVIALLLVGAGFGMWPEVALHWGFWALVALAIMAATVGNGLAAEHTRDPGVERPA